jgi:hypothetical protein
MSVQPFTRPTIVAANEFIAEAARKHTETNQLVLRLNLEVEIPIGSSLGIERKRGRLCRDARRTEAAGTATSFGSASANLAI